MKRNLRLLLIATALLITVAVGARATQVGAQNVARPAASAATCQNIQLLIRPDLGSGAAGHYGVMYRIQNLSRATCTLYGFPGAVLLDSNFNSLPTRVERVTNLAGSHPPRLVTLTPGGRAYFVLEWAQVPTGNESCPRAKYMMITAPNDRLPDVTYAAPRQSIVTPCGGRLMASTVQPTPFSI